VASSTNKKPSAKGWEQAKFINYALSVEQKREIKASPWNGDDTDNFLARLAEADYKVTFSWDTYGECFAAHLIPKGDKHRNAGFILAGRGSSPSKALKQACYMHYQIFEEDWTEWYSGGSREPLDD